MENTMTHSRYIVGIDLGTTNCVVSYIDTSKSEDLPESGIFRIPHITEAGVAEDKDSLPSFLYIPEENELPEKSLSLPWTDENDYAVGTFARKRGAEVPVRLVSSAKSWLCYPAVDRTAQLLPWSAPEQVTKISPLEATARYLDHIRRAWNHTVAEGSSENFLEHQDVFVTVPASFDAVARDLTVRAAEKAGLKITLLEEPLAAFYSWLHDSGEEWRDNVRKGDVILVCDLGGGTTDFSIIEVEDEAGELVLKRIAVGDHILLGGDNMDLTLAYEVRKHFSERKINLDAWQMLGLIHKCRDAKEQMLNIPDCKTRPVVILGRGRSVIGGTLETELRREEVIETIINGFFPECTVEERPVEKRAAGFRELGLQYAADTAVTKHLAKFLRQHAREENGNGSKFIHPTKIVFNGGVTKASAVRERIIAVLNGWLSAESSAPVDVLHGSDPDTAVALGAAYYGFAKRGKGIRIRAGAERSYYIGIETSMPTVPGMPSQIRALCVVPLGMEEGTDFKVPGQEFGLVVGEEAAFRFFASTVRKNDSPGSVIDEWDEEEIVELSSLETKLHSEGVEPGTLVPIKLHSYLNEIGVLELWCEASDGSGRWKLEFNVRLEDN